MTALLTHGYSRRGLRLLLQILLVTEAANASADQQAPLCRNVEGAEALLSNPEKRYIIVGERHGTAETPALFADLACLASAKGPLIVGLEMEADQQRALDAFLASDGSAAARQAWRRARHWQLRDGRGSTAMWTMIEELRRLKAKGRDLTAIAFMHQASTVEARERAMADAWRAALDARKDARLLILVGSVHAESEPIGQSVPAASFVPRRVRLTLSYVPWEAVRCGPYLCRSAGAGNPRVLAQVPAEWRWPRYDAYYTVGRRFTPSAPAPESPE
jgi:hypothetical protein